MKKVKPFEYNNNNNNNDNNSNMEITPYSKSPVLE